MAPHIAILVNDWNELRFWTKSDHTITCTQGSIDGNQVSKAQPRGKPSVNPQLMAIWIGSFQKSEPGKIDPAFI